ncbi:MAG: hypothetical protein ONB17_01180 [candidate division KSB1 bacterium]|nr:hypothetical protein [candidate division KSB1 bacterium]MDZ7295177.1 hypothetical protein [candidate division KSB1 bacterium]MDZ7378074.1 hypothetical protein [candidate division KSB1 bacterium]MDZ7384914.1 hypothetical protein [candidate division KSB1 bacterium]MDZ7391968.1 hypothetical protein [candidate division KSB1 bacterium]
MSSSSLRILGIALIAGGVVLLLAATKLFSISALWPLIPLTIGVAMAAAYFTGPRSPSLLLGGIMVGLASLLFLYCALLGWDKMAQLWPLFLAAPGGAFLVLYALTRESNSLSVAIMLIIAAALFMVLNQLLGRFWGVVLVLVGVILFALSALRKS